MALSGFWRGVLTVGAALGAGVVLSYVLGGRRSLPSAPATTDPPIDEENCSRAFFPSPNRGDAGGLDAPLASPPSWIVLHDTEGPGRVGEADEDSANARANASYFSNPAAKVSTHLVVDDLGECYRCVADDEIAWGAGAANTRALQIEMAAPAGAATKWSREEWLSRETMLSTAAAHVALWCDTYGIPATFVDAEGLKRGERGITTHAEVTKAFGGSHIDPGPNFPIDDFVYRVRARTSGIV